MAGKPRGATSIPLTALQQGGPWLQNRTNRGRALRLLAISGLGSQLLTLQRTLFKMGLCSPLGAAERSDLKPLGLGLGKADGTPLPTAQFSFMVKQQRKQQPTRKSSRARKPTVPMEAAPTGQMGFVSHAKFAAKAKMGVRAALKLDLRPAEEDRQALLKCLKKWLGEAEDLRRGKKGASGGQVWSGSQDFSKAEWEAMTREIKASARYKAAGSKVRGRGAGAWGSVRKLASPSASLTHILGMHMGGDQGSSPSESAPLRLEP
jgi:hypothetical protein